MIDSIQTKRSIVGCVGMTTIDTFFFVNSFPSHNESVREVREMNACIGGKGFVTAATLFELGYCVRLFTSIGPPQQGQVDLVAHLPADFDCTHIKTWLNFTNQTWITISATQEAHILTRTGTILQTALTEIDAASIEFVDNLDILYLSFDVPIVLCSVLQAGRTKKLIMVTNLNLALLRTLSVDRKLLLAEIVSCSDALLMNESESKLALELLKYQSWFDLPTPKDIIITKGKDGAIGKSGEQTNWDSYCAFEVNDPSCVVGAGDAFNAAYIGARYIDRRSFSESCGIAARVAADNVMLCGSTRFRVN